MAKHKHHWKKVGTAYSCSPHPAVIERCDKCGEVRMK